MHVWRKTRRESGMDRALEATPVSVPIHTKVTNRDTKGRSVSGTAAKTNSRMGTIGLRISYAPRVFSQEDSRHPAHQETPIPLLGRIVPLALQEGVSIVVKRDTCLITARRRQVSKPLRYRTAPKGHLSVLEE
jgi:hypothetical protein